MPLSYKIPKISLRRQGKRGGARFAVVHWDRETINFQVCSSKSQRLPNNHYGAIDWTQHEHPLAALAERFRSESIQVQRLVVLLTRPMLDVLTLSLPVADETEIPMLVANEVEQQLGDTEEPPAIDYYVLPPSDAVPSLDDAIAAVADGNGAERTPTGLSVLAFAMTAAELGKLTTSATENGFRLAAVCPRHLAPLGILRRRHIPTEALSVSVHLYANEAELMICHGLEPLFLRAIRVNPEAIDKTLEQLTLEVQRCSTLLPASLAAVNMNWYVFATCDSAHTLAASLKIQADANVQTVNPLLGWELDEDPLDAEVAAGQDSLAGRTQASAANSGAAWDFQRDELRVNILNPKKAPPAPNPALRWGGIGAAAALVVALAIYFLLSDIQKLRGEVQALEDDLQGAEKLAAKYEEKADQVALVEGWLNDQVDWLSELNELSDRLPKGNQATVRRLTASTSGNTAVIDLSVQVAEQDNVSDLESRIRSVKYSVSSKRISQKADSSEYPWRFETRVEFPVQTSKLDTVSSEDYQPPQNPSDNNRNYASDAEDNSAIEDPTVKDSELEAPVSEDAGENGSSKDAASKASGNDAEQEQHGQKQPSNTQPVDEKMPTPDISPGEVSQ